MKNVIICLSIIIIMNIVVGKSKSLQVLDFESERDLKKYMKEKKKCRYTHLPLYNALHCTKVHAHYV